MPDGQKILSGEHRSPGPAVRTIIEADGDSPPEALFQESYSFLGDADVDFARYSSPKFFEREQQKLWPKVWQWACREEYLPEVGDYYVYDIGKISILIVRNEGGVVNPDGQLFIGTRKARSAGSSRAASSIQWRGAISRWENALH